MYIDDLTDAIVAVAEAEGWKVEAGINYKEQNTLFEFGSLSGTGFHRLQRHVHCDIRRYDTPVPGKHALPAFLHRLHRRLLAFPVHSLPQQDFPEGMTAGPSPALFRRMSPKEEWTGDEETLYLKDSLYLCRR